MLFSNLRRDFKYYSIALIAGVGTSILLFLFLIIISLIQGYRIDFLDHSIRLFILMIKVLSYGVFLSVLEFYIIFSFIDYIRSNRKKLKLINIICLILLHLVFSAVLVFIFLLGINHFNLALIGVTILFLVPYLIMIIKKLKLKLS